MTAAGGTAGDEANEAISPDATASETKTIRRQTPIRDGDADLGSTIGGAGSAPLGDWSPSVDPLLALGGDSVSGGGDPACFRHTEDSFGCRKNASLIRSPVA